MHCVGLGEMLSHALFYGIFLIRQNELREAEPGHTTVF